MATAPKDRAVRLVFGDDSGQWVSHAEYMWTGKAWCSCKSGFRVPSHLTVLGWNEISADDRSATRETD